MHLSGLYVYAWGPKEKLVFHFYDKAVCVSEDACTSVGF